MPVCPRCASALDPNGICAVCLLAVGLDTEAYAQQTATLPAATDATGAMIGRYLLLQKIGEGGMGEVWLAEQKEPVRRRVALKLVKAGMSSREVLARFDSERQALALMDHPAIAKVLDAGSTPQGLPYFVMEYVAGVPITAYCDNHRLGTRERLDLFVHVCEGVQHAHQKAIIHRDLKPSNILVTEVDGKPAPRIIDFGVAKALTSKLTADALFTRVGAMIGTPEYMSPEQALSSGEDIDTRADVYSLGIVLYELLAGARPIELHKIAFDEFLRKLRDEDAPKPSTRIRSQDPATSTQVARNRQTEPQTLAKQIRGDLDSITLKALEKERSRRYGSPSDLAADISRYLRHEAVLAVPPSAAYRARKFARRNRAALVTLCAFVLVLIVAAGVSIWESVTARRERDRADAEAAIAKAVNLFLQSDLLSAANPENQGGGDNRPDPDIRVRTLLDRAAARVEKRFAGQQAVESAIQETIATAYLGLGLYPQAEQHFRRSYQLSVAQRGPDDPKTLNILMMVSSVDIDQDKKAEAVSTAKTVLHGFTRTLGPDHPQTVVALQNLASLYFQNSQYALAEPLAKKALDIQERRNGYDNLDTLNSSDTLASLYIVSSQYGRARALLAKGLESYRRLYGPEHPFTGREMFGLGKVLLGEGDYPGADKVLSDVLSLYQHAYGPRHPNTMYVENQLGQAWVEEGKTAEGIALLEKTLADSRAVVGPAAEDTLRVEMSLGWAFDGHGELARAAEIWQHALQGFRSMGHAEEDKAADAAELLGQNFTTQRQYAQAEPLLRRALAFRDKGDPDDWMRFRAQLFLGRALAGLHRDAEAEPLLRSGHDGLQQRISRMPAKQKKWLRLT